MTVLDAARPYLNALNERKISLRAVAEKLGCNESYLCRILQPHLDRVESAHSTRKKQSKLAESRRFMREKHAFLVKNGQKSLKRGASDARCSERTLRRYISALKGPQ